MLTSLLTRWRNLWRSKSRRRAGRSKPRPYRRLQITTLEDRELLNAGGMYAFGETWGHSHRHANPFGAERPALTHYSPLAVSHTVTSTLDNGLPTVGSVTPFSSPTVSPLTSIPPAPSPTGWTPRLLWTAQQQGIWEQEMKTNSPWWQLIQHYANATGTTAQAPGDDGAWAALAYQITDNAAYAQKAWTAVQKIISQPAGVANRVRNWFMDAAWMYDWLRPALTTAQRTTYYTELNNWATWVLGGPGTTNSVGIRCASANYTVSYYFGLAFVDYGTAPDNPLAGTWLNQYSRGSYKIPVGGLVPTGADWNSARDAIANYVQLSQGGAFVEGSMYSENTMRLLFMGAEGLLTATGKDYFPEVTAFANQVALAQINVLTPDLLQSYQWGDEQYPRQLWLTKRMDLLTMVAGMTQSNPNVGPYVNQLIADFVAKWGLSPKKWPNAMPATPDGVIEYNPYAASSNWSGALPNGYYSPGRGIEFYHNGWSSTSSFLAAQMDVPTGIDHDIQMFGNFQLYRNGEWGVVNPIGYGTMADSGAAGNDMLIAGLSSMAQHGPVAQEFGANNNYAYIAGTTSGSLYGAGFYQPPPSFLNEWTRELFYLPSANGGPDTVVVFDRVNALDPQTLPLFSHYRAGDQALIKAAPALKQWIINAPVTPTLTSTGATWLTAGGQQVQLTTLSPQGTNVNIYSQSSLLSASNDFISSQISGYQLRISPKTTQQWDTFLNVVQVGAKGAAVKNTLVQATNGEAQGTLLHGALANDTLVLFSSDPSTRVLSSGYTVNFTSGTSTANAYVTDLDPTKTWTVSVDGGAAQTITVSTAGVASLTVSGTGAHSLVLTAS